MIKPNFIAVVILFSACLMAGAQEDENQLT